jgi:hypothetical protein
VANFWYFAPKKRKNQRKTWEKTCCFQFSVTILFSAKIHHFCKAHKRKIKQNATTVFKYQNFPTITISMASTIASLVYKV